MPPPRSLLRPLRRSFDASQTANVKMWDKTRLMVKLADLKPPKMDAAEDSIHNPI